MKESNLKLAQKDIDDALKAVEEMENCISEGNEKNNIIKEKFITLTEKVQKLENLLKTEGILYNRKKRIVNLSSFILLTKTAIILSYHLITSLYLNSPIPNKYYLYLIDCVPSLETTALVNVIKLILLYHFFLLFQHIFAKKLTIFNFILN